MHFHRNLLLHHSQILPHPLCSGASGSHGLAVYQFTFLCISKHVHVYQHVHVSVLAQGSAIPPSATPSPSPGASGESLAVIFLTASSGHLPCKCTVARSAVFEATFCYIAIQTHFNFGDALGLGWIGMDEDGFAKNFRPWKFPENPHGFRAKETTLDSSENC